MLKTISFAELPALGAALDDGLFAGITTQKDGTHAAVILLPNKAQEGLTWNQATEWAAEAGGQLPTRPVSALLYANAKDQFEPEWHWTADQLQDDTKSQYDSGYAWIQYFDYGTQSYDYELCKAHVRAVRLIQLNP